MATTSVSARFQELFPETNLISLLTKYGGDADDIFEAIQDRYDAHEQEPLFPSPQRSRRHRRRSRSRRPHHASRK